MPSTKTIDTFKFEELTGNAREKANAYLVTCSQDHNWWQYTYDEWIPKLEERGFDDPIINFSGFWSQGDGASFTCDSVDIERWIKFHKLGNKYRKLLAAAKNGEVGVKIYRISNYYHDKTMFLNSDENYIGDGAYAEWKEVYPLLLEDARGLAREIYEALEGEDEFMCSDEVLKEFANGNDIVFTEDGHAIYE